MTTSASTAPKKAGTPSVIASPVCPIGGSDCSPVYWRNTEMGCRDLRIYRCARCLHAFIPERSYKDVSDFHDGAYRLKYYRDDIEKESNRAGVIDERFHEVRSKFTLGRWERIRQYCKPEHAVLDVGCGAGSFARHAAKRVRLVHGLELSGWFVDYINNTLPVTAFKTLLEDYNTEQRYDIIVTWHCLEHTVDARRFLTRASELLKPGGMLFVEVPTIADWENPPRGGFYNDSHVHYFSPESLARLVGERFDVFESWPGLQPPATMLGAQRR